MSLTETVCVFRRTEVGEDSMGEPEYEWASENVSGVLVKPLEGEELNDALRPDGIRVSYRLAFPKAYTKDLTHTRIALVERQDSTDLEKAFRVSKPADTLKACPTSWNRVVEIGRVDG